jgi:hypothetical protein
MEASAYASCGACGGDIAIDVDLNMDGHPVESVLNGFYCEGGCQRPIHFDCAYHHDVCDQCDEKLGWCGLRHWCVRVCAAYLRSVFPDNHLTPQEIRLEIRRENIRRLSKGWTR